jgi:hypothetical protein
LSVHVPAFDVPEIVSLTLNESAAFSSNWIVIVLPLAEIPRSSESEPESSEVV